MTLMREASSFYEKWNIIKLIAKYLQLHKMFKLLKEIGFLMCSMFPNYFEVSNKRTVYAYLFS